MNAEQILNFLDRNRRAGTTTLIKEIAASKDVIVLCATKEEARDFRGGVNIQNPPRMHESKPLLMDNHTMMTLVREWLYDNECHHALKAREKKLEERIESLKYDAAKKQEEVLRLVGICGGLRRDIESLEEENADLTATVFAEEA